MATIGLRDVYYALLLTDVAAGVATYGAPTRMVGAISANVNPNSSSATLFADDGPQDTAATLGEISLELNLSDIDLPTQAVILGSTYTNGILKRKGGDVPPWLAIAFRTLKSNGSYRYYWLLKGKFACPEDDLATKADSIEFKTPTIKGSFVKRDADDQWENIGDEDEAEFTADMKAHWFDKPDYVPSGNTVPSITTTTLTGGTVGTAYSATIAATGTAPITFAVTAGSLPAGLGLVGNTISGTPTTAGTSTFTITATNVIGADPQELSLVVS